LFSSEISCYYSKRLDEDSWTGGWFFDSDLGGYCFLFLFSTGGDTFGFYYCGFYYTLTSSLIISIFISLESPDLRTYRIISIFYSIDLSFAEYYYFIWTAVCSGFLAVVVTPVPTGFFLIGGGGWVVLV